MKQGHPQLGKLREGSLRAGTRRSTLGVTERESLNHTCPYCYAGPGFWCCNNNGSPAVQLHLPRLLRVAGRPQ